MLINKLTLALKLLFISILLGLIGCSPPLNSVFESAKMLDKNQLDIQANYSTYNGRLVDPTRNVGLGIGYGINNNSMLKLRFEKVSHQQGIFNELSQELFDSSNIFYANKIYELSFKHQIKKDKIAFAIPLTYYRNNFFGNRSTIDPRFYFTITNSNKFELNIIAKAHIGRNYFLPGLNLGMAFSNNLKKWAIRPEIGYDGIFTAGIGLNFYPKLFKTKK